MGLIESTENSRLLYNRDPSTIRTEEFGGNKLAVDCIHSARYWLEATRDVCVDENTFNTQILGPVREAAGCIINTRMLANKTTTITGWVFKISEPYERNTSDKKYVIVSLVAPALKTITSIRVDAEKISASRCFYTFENVQPVPLTNRLHQIRPRFNSTFGIPKLAEWNFLKVGFGDYEEFTRSMEMENFCEIGFVSDERPHLGSAFVMACKILSIRPPQIVLGDITDSNVTRTMFLSDDVLRGINPNELKDYEEKYARIMAVQEYSPPISDDQEEQAPKVILIEIEDSMKKLVGDDAIGYVRMRHSVDLEEMATRYKGQDIRAVSGIFTRDGITMYQSDNVSEDPVIGEFLSSVQRIRFLRRKNPIAGLQVGPYDIVGQDKLSAVVGSKALLKEEHAAKLEILQRIQTSFDTIGEMLAEDDVASMHGASERNIGWLKWADLVEKHDECLGTTKLGRRVLGLVFKADLEKMTRSLQVMSFINDQDNNIPPSIIYDYLSKKDSGFEPSIMDGFENRAYWMQAQSAKSLNPDLEKEFETYCNNILKCMQHTNHPFTAIKIGDEMRQLGIQTSYFAVNIVVRIMEKKKILISSGSSWEYPLVGKLNDFLRDSGKSHSTDQIIEQIKIGLKDKNLVEIKLAGLEKNGMVVQLGKGVWRYCRDLDRDAQIKEYNTDLIKSRLLRLLKTKKVGMDEVMLLQYANWATQGLDVGSSSMDRKDVVKCCLGELESQGYIVCNETMYKPVAKNDTSN